MSDRSAFSPAPVPASPVPRADGAVSPITRRRLAVRPSLLLVILSAVLGTACVLLNPPLRGPDEQAHFARVYAYAHGTILPSVEVEGRKGVYVPADLHDDFVFFNSRRYDVWTPGFSFRTVFEAYRERGPAPETAVPRDPVFVPFEGSEGYTPIAYAPHIVAAVAANLLGLDFVTTVAVIRFAGLAAFTAVSAWAIATTPHLKWAFFLIAMLPASLYGRSVIGADGAVNSTSLMVTALALRAIAGDGGPSPLRRSVWMLLCVMGKPPQVAFVLLEPMIHRWGSLALHRRAIALVVLPALAAALAWIWAVDAEMAAWRISEGSTYPAEQFTLGWKLAFMLENPAHFPTMVVTTITNETFGLWRQTIGVLGWLDTHLNVWVYAAITLLAVTTTLDRPAFPLATRLRIAGYGTMLVAAYMVAVFAILFITWTPPEEPQVWGVQGRYFVPVLPIAACVVAAVTVRLPPAVCATAAVAGAVVSGLATIEGLWRVNWVP